MKVYTAAAMKAADLHTISEQHISSSDLMEKAATAISNDLLDRYPKVNNYLVCCGSGNNGGDGLCVARHLAFAGKKVTVWLTASDGEGSADYLLNLHRLPQIVHRVPYSFQSVPDDIEIVIDALFGTGIHSDIRGLHAELINQLNASGKHLIAIDLPSGLRTELPTSGVCIQAAETLTLGYPKLALLMPENAGYTGEWRVLPFGLYETFPGSEHPVAETTGHQDVPMLYRPRQRISHKGHFGHVLVLGGSEGMEGAGNLCAHACLQAGAGLTTLATHGNSGLRNEVMRTERNRITEGFRQGRYTTLAAGPGLGVSKVHANLLKEVLPFVTKGIVLDADALHLIKLDETLLKILPENSILTPHPKEFAALTEQAENDFITLNNQIRFSMMHGVFVVLKRSYTCITSPQGEVWFNESGNPGMATAGSGDVLTGIIAALLAQGYPSASACRLGVYVHGLAGDLAMADHGGNNLMAGDLITWIQRAYAQIKK